MKTQERIADRDLAACAGDEETVRGLVEEALASDQAITLLDVGPVRALSIPIRPGVVVLRGANDSGKSLSLEAVSRLAGGNGTVTCRDKAAAGYVEGLGVKISVRQSARRSGELEALSIEGKLSIADLVDPKIKDPAAADRQRIKALLQLNGARADLALFAARVPSPWSPADVFSAETERTDDLVEMAAKAKRDLEGLSRQLSEAAKKETDAALVCMKAVEAVDLNAESDAGVLQAGLEYAVQVHSALAAKAQAAEEVKRRADQAAENLKNIELQERLSLDEFRRRDDEANRDLKAAKGAVAAAERALLEAQSKEQTARIHADYTAKALEQAERQEQLIAGWRETIQQAETTESPSHEQIHTAATAVVLARQSLERGAIVRHARAMKVEADIHAQKARDLANSAESLRQAAHATDEVLSEAVASDALVVKHGRLVTQHPERGEVFYAERSDGTRWRLAIDEAIKRIRQLGAEQTAIIPVPQSAWSELDPENKAAIHEYAVSQGVTIVTAEATTGPLRAEEFADDAAKAA